MSARQGVPVAPARGGLWQDLKRMLREAEQGRTDAGEVIFVGEFAPALFVRAAPPRAQPEDRA
ncbi:hypothetical protein [Zavarzinia sp. CC-PAN008]|uniref:hypothetical protein n=1 Tax=Zavarzinia sp. CC-PAN008 TaxID=3243332 RepID=UPI003F749CB5